MTQLLYMRLRYCIDCYDNDDDYYDYESVP